MRPTYDDKTNSRSKGSEMPLRVVVIVEGHGEDGAIRTLLERIWYDLLRGDYIEVIPWRGKQGQLLSAGGEELRSVVKAAAIKLHATVHTTEQTDFRRLLLIMVDTEGLEENCPMTRAPALVATARKERSDPATEIACVLPNVMFETWFAAAAHSLRDQNGLASDLPKSKDPEGDRLGKSWLKKHLSRKYKETVDQARFVAKMDLEECKNSSRSFRKLVGELKRRLPGQTTSTAPPAPEAKQD